MNKLHSYNPYDLLPQVPSFTVYSKALKDKNFFGLKQISAPQGGYNLSPDLGWSGFPEETKSFAVTMYDPDAPTASGYWHWVAFDIPRNVTSLPEGAGTENNPFFPRVAVTLENDSGIRGYFGPMPPKGHGLHRYFIVVHALSLGQIDIHDTAHPAVLGGAMFECTLARATLIGLWEYPEGLEEPSYA